MTLFSELMMQSSDLFLTCSGVSKQHAHGCAVNPTSWLERASRAASRRADISDTVWRKASSLAFAARRLSSSDRFTWEQ